METILIDPEKLLAKHGPVEERYQKITKGDFVRPIALLTTGWNAALILDGHHRAARAYFWKRQVLAVVVNGPEELRELGLELEANNVAEFGLDQFRIRCETDWEKNGKLTLVDFANKLIKPVVMSTNDGPMLQHLAKLFEKKHKP